MSKIPDGYQNEFLFVLEFNNKKVSELNPLLREVVDDLFPYAKDDSIIKSWKNHNSYEKADIFIKINNVVKSISIKKGSKNSVHTENIQSFKVFLKKMNIDDKTIDLFLSYHFGIDKEDKTKFLSTKEYVSKYSDELTIINNEFSKINTYSIVERFILKGRISNINVDGIIYGIPNDFFWINKDDIYEIISRSKDKKSNSVHFGSLYIQPLNRCLNENVQNMALRNYVQVKWYSLFDDIIEYKNYKVMKDNLITY